MLVTFTNAFPDFKGDRVAINTDAVLTIRSMTVVREPGDSKKKKPVEETVTFIHCPPHGTWEVSESYDEVLKAINAAKELNKDSKKRGIFG